MILSASGPRHAAHCDAPSQLDGGGDAHADVSASKARLLSRLIDESQAPLNAIIRLSAVLLDKADAPSAIGSLCRTDDLIAHINTAGNQLLDLLENAADIAQIEDGRLPPAFRSLCVNDLILDVVGRLAPMSEQFGIPVQMSLDPDLPCCMIDAVRMRCALRSVIRNAIEFSKPNGVVDIWTTRSAERGIVVTVADRGVGIPDKDLEEIFLPLHRRVSAAAECPLGPGNGLVLAKRYIEYHRGNIWLTSKPGIGTTVEIDLPHVAPKRWE